MEPLKGDGQNETRRLKYHVVNSLCAAGARGWGALPLEDLGAIVCGGTTSWLHEVNTGVQGGDINHSASSVQSRQPWPSDVAIMSPLCVAAWHVLFELCLVICLIYISPHLWIVWFAVSIVNSVHVSVIILQKTTWFMEAHKTRNSSFFWLSSLTASWHTHTHARPQSFCCLLLTHLSLQFIWLQFV